MAHVPNDELSTDEVIDTVKNITELISGHFPNVTVYPCLGNHDYHPKHLMPPRTNRVYQAVGDLWSRWLPGDAVATFKRGKAENESHFGFGWEEGCRSNLAGVKDDVLGTLAKCFPKYCLQCFPWTAEDIHWRTFWGVANFSIFTHSKLRSWPLPKIFAKFIASFGGPGSVSTQDYSTILRRLFVLRSCRKGRSIVVLVFFFGGLQCCVSECFTRKHNCDIATQHGERFPCCFYSSLCHNFKVVTQELYWRAVVATGYLLSAVCLNFRYQG